MLIVNESELCQKKNPEYIEELIQYCLFYSLKGSLNTVKLESKRIHCFHTIVGLWFSNEKSSKNNSAIIFFQTTEALFNFIKFFIGFTNKIKILNFSNKTKTKMKNTFVYLALNNNLNYINISSKLLKILKVDTPDFYSINNLFKEFFILTEYKKGKLEYIFINTLHHNKKTSSPIIYQKCEKLIFDATINYQKLPILLNSVNLNVTTSLEFFFESLELIVKIPKTKILFISNDLSRITSFCKKDMRKNSLIIKNTTSILSILKVLKKFNSNQSQSLFICDDNWKKDKLFNRIDSRNLTIIFKINLNNKTTNYNIKSFFYF